MRIEGSVLGPVGEDEGGRGVGLFVVNAINDALYVGACCNLRMCFCVDFLGKYIAFFIRHFPVVQQTCFSPLSKISF